MKKLQVFDNTRKAAMSGQSLAGVGQSTATAPLKPEGDNG